jgi:hypothetical protein
MSEVDEARIKELAKLPPKVLRGADGPAVQEVARKVVEILALIPSEKQDAPRGQGS